MPNLIVSGLNIYPLKSAQGISLNTLSFGALGPNWDRRWMLVDADNNFITQRQFPRLCLIVVECVEGQLKIQLPSFPVFYAEASGIEQTVKVWRDEVIAQDCGDTAAAYLSDFLQIKCRLVFLPENSKRLVDKDYTGKPTAANQQRVSFADGFPLLLISQASLDDLNSRLTHPITMQHFRPNIVVSGCEPFAEDGWQHIKIGGLNFSVVKSCSRCVIPSINPLTAEKNSEVLKVLASYRRRKEGGKTAIYFGQNMLSATAGMITLGDKVELIE